VPAANPVSGGRRHQRSSSTGVLFFGLTGLVRLGINYQRGGAMASFYPPKLAFGPIELETLDQAVEAAWNRVERRSPAIDSKKKEALKVMLRKRVFAFARHGVSDPETLQKLALRNLALDA
jgi:hypothetical protein